MNKPKLLSELKKESMNELILANTNTIKTMWIKIPIIFIQKQMYAILNTEFFFTIIW